MYIRFIAAIFSLALCFSHSSLGARPLSADDFLPPAQAQSEEEKQRMEQIQQPDAVKEETGFDGKQAISAATAQDAINTVAQNIAVAGGCEQIKFPSGFGWVAVGTESYEVMPNPTATLAAQRLAYQKAYMKAKKSLTTTLYDLSSEGHDQLQQEIKTILTTNDAVANLAELSSENITEYVKGLLKGYVVYNVNDAQEQDHGIVTVTIVTTPKTMGKTNRLDSFSISTDSIRDGLNHVLTELSSGLMPPVGGKTLNVPQTGELAFIGFGSALLQSNQNPAVQAKLALNAQKTAKMRARSALCGIILGDDITAMTSLDSQTQIISKQFDELQKDDPVSKERSEGQLALLQEQKHSFLSRELNNEQIRSIRSGVLPPGVIVKVFVNREKTLAQAIAVYIPSVSREALRTRNMMKNSRIIPSRKEQGGEFDTRGKMPSRGPSGQVMNDADL